MLTGKQVRVRISKNKLLPQYLPADSQNWHDVAEQLLFIYRDSVGRTRGEIEEQLADIVGDGPTQLIHQGFAKLLEDRCEMDVASDFPPEQIREAVFRLSASQRIAREPFDRDAIITQAAEGLQLAPQQIEAGLFADLKDEQRIVSFDDCTPEQLVLRYNVALAQAILLRATHVEVRIWSETPARFRQIFRAIKFRKLIFTIRPTDEHGYKLELDGPLSLFSSTQKYGLQLALFLPQLLHCKAFDLRAQVRWGAQKVEKQFTLSGLDGLRSHLPDFGMHTPREIELFAENFRANVPDWVLSDDPNPQTVGGTTWVPDFTLMHKESGKEVFVEVVGFWQKRNIEEHYLRLKKAMPGRFLLVVSEQYRADEESEFTLGDGVYRYKRTPIAAEVAKRATLLIGE